MTVESGGILEEPCERPHYTLDDLLAKCNPKAERSEQEDEWLQDEPVDAELI
jgi:antitoxin ChpS